MVATMSMAGLTAVPAAITSAHAVHNHVKQTSKLKVQHIYLTVIPGMKLDLVGKLHDAFSPANFTLVQGVPANITITIA